MLSIKQAPSEIMWNKMLQYKKEENEMLKEMYLRPAVVGADCADTNGIIPLAAVTIVKGAALLAGYAAGRAVAKAMAARPSISLRGIKTKEDFSCDL